MLNSKKLRSHTSRPKTTRRSALRIESLEGRALMAGLAPDAMNDIYQSLQGETLTVPVAAAVLANDTDPEGDVLTAQLFSGPRNGQLDLSPDGSFAYTPDSDFAGLDGFMYLASDGTGSSWLAAVSISVEIPNRAPVAVNDAFTMNEDEPLHIDGPGLLANDSDADQDSLTLALANPPLHGTVTFNADGSFDYVPNANFVGVDGFGYVALDGQTESDVAAVTIEVLPVNDAPAAASDEYLASEDVSLVIDVAGGALANDADVDGDALAANLVSGPAHGSLTFNADGSFEYMPTADFNGADSFVYRATDGELESTDTTVTINVASANDAPVAANEEYSASEDVPLVIDVASGVLANDTDLDGDALAANLVSGPAQGSLTLNADGSFEYTPAADFNGADSFVYRATDGELESTDITVTINIAPANDAPVAASEEYSASEDAPLVIDVASGILANDTDIDGNALAANLVSGPAHGSLTLNADGSFEYTPAADFNGADSFVYRTTDGELESTETIVTINVAPTNDASVAANDEYLASEDMPLVIDAAVGVLANDTDIDGDALAANLVSGPAHGSLTLNADGSFEYMPAADFNGTDSFVYRATDGALESADTTVTINVAPVNDASIAASDDYSATEDVPLVIDAAGGVLANETDIDGDALTATLVSGPAHGSLTLNADGSFEYTPAANFNGADSFVYRATDGELESADSTVTINVAPVNDTPLATNDRYNGTVNQPLEIPAAGVIANDSDPDGDALVPQVFSEPEHGTVTVNGDGSFVYSPNEGFQGRDSFLYRVFDGAAYSLLAAVTIQVNPAATVDTELAPAESEPPTSETPVATPPVEVPTSTKPEAEPTDVWTIVADEFSHHHCHGGVMENLVDSLAAEWRRASRRFHRMWG